MPSNNTKGVQVAKESKDPDPYGLNVSGYGMGYSPNGSKQIPKPWADTQISGGNELLGRTTTETYNKKKGGTNNQPTATALLSSFSQLRGSQLAELQDKLYRAGFYGSDRPNYGSLDATKDIDAFKRALISHLASGQQTDLSSFLNQAVSTYQATGTRTKTPLVVKLTNPDDLRITLQKTVQDLYGGNLPEDQVQKFIQSFQSDQAAEQTAAYTAGGFNPETGQSDLSGSQTAGGTVTGVASPAAAAEAFTRTNYPNQVAATAFGNALNNIIDTLKRPAV